MKIYVDEKGHIIFSYATGRGETSFELMSGGLSAQGVLRLVKFLIDYTMRSMQP